MKTKDQNTIRHKVNSESAKKIPITLLKEVKRGIVLRNSMMPCPPYD